MKADVPEIILQIHLDKLSVAHMGRRIALDAAAGLVRCSAGVNREVNQNILLYPALVFRQLLAHPVNRALPVI